MMFTHKYRRADCKLSKNQCVQDFWSSVVVWKNFVVPCLDVCLYLYHVAGGQLRVLCSSVVV